MDKKIAEKELEEKAEQYVSAATASVGKQRATVEMVVVDNGSMDLLPQIAMVIDELAGSYHILIDIDTEHLSMALTKKNELKYNYKWKVILEYESVWKYEVEE